MAIRRAGSASGHIERRGWLGNAGRRQDSNRPARAAIASVAGAQGSTIPTVGGDRPGQGKCGGLKRDLPTRAAVLAALILGAERAVGRTAIGVDFPCHNGLSSENRDRTAYVAVRLAVTGCAAVRTSVVRWAAGQSISVDAAGSIKGETADTEGKIVGDHRRAVDEADLGESLRTGKNDLC